MRYAKNGLSLCRTIIGIISLILAIFLCRFDIFYTEVLLPRLPSWLVSWISFNNGQISFDSPIRYWRSSTPLGLFFLAIGVALLTFQRSRGAFLGELSETTDSNVLINTDSSQVNQSQRSLLHVPKPLNAEPPPSSRTLLNLGSLTLLSILAAYLLEQLQLLNSIWCFVAWIMLISTQLIYFYRVDLKKHIPLKIPLSWREIFFLLAGSFALILFYQRGVDSWRYAFIGDEYGFLTFAISLLSKPFADASPLEASGYAEFFPMLLSWWQALFLLLFGEHNAAWRLSVAVITASSLIPFYIFLKSLLLIRATEIAHKDLRNKYYLTPILLVAGTFLFLSEFTVVWAKIGKPHAVFLPPAIFASSALILGIRNSSNFYLFLAGVFAGLGMYLSSLSPILALASCGTLLVTLELKFNLNHFLNSLKQIGLKLLFILSAFLLISAPLLVQFDFWQNMFEVNLTSVEATRNSKMFWAKLLSAVMLPLEFRTGIHFMSGNPVDVVSALLILIGLTTARIVGWRSLSFAMLLHLQFSLLAGALSKYHYPPESRMMVAMFPLAILAAFGFIGICNLWTSPIIPSIKPRLNAASQGGLSIIISAWIAVYHWVKLEEYNPHSHQVDSSIAILKSIQQSDNPQSHYWIFASPLINRQPLEFFSLFFSTNFSFLSFLNNSHELEQMKLLVSQQLQDHQSSKLPYAIIIDEQDPNIDRVTEMAKEHAIRVLLFNAWAIPLRRVDLAHPVTNYILPLIRILENRRGSLK